VLKRILSLLVAFPLGVLLIALAVANRHAVRIALNPFKPEDTVLSFDVPVFLYSFSLLLLGILVGGAAAWFGQSRWRRTARRRTQEAMRWQAEADRLARERDADVAGRKGQLAVARR
jgi:uncharacterized integral membrane protein